MEFLNFQYLYVFSGPFPEHYRDHRSRPAYSLELSGTTPQNGTSCCRDMCAAPAWKARAFRAVSKGKRSPTTTTILDLQVPRVLAYQLFSSPTIDYQLPTKLPLIRNQIILYSYNSLRLVVLWTKSSINITPRDLPHERTKPYCRSRHSQSESHLSGTGRACAWIKWMRWWRSSTEICPAQLDI